MGRKVDLEKVLSLWESDMRNDELAEALGVTRGGLVRLRDRLGLPVRPEKADRTQRPDPTEEEIEQRAAQVRAGWNDRQRNERWQRGDRLPRAAKHNYSFRNSSFSAMDR